MRKAVRGLAKLKYQKVVRAFLASPGDTTGERDALAGVVDELNRTWADFVGIRIDLIKWESHAVPAAGPDPQAAINEQPSMGDDQYEIFIGILKQRLGSPTPRALSGTVEEFERAHARYSTSGLPEIMFYFQEEADHDIDTARFKQRLKDLGVLYWLYRNKRNFAQASRIHLSRQMQRVARGDFARPGHNRTFPDPEGLDLSGALQKVEGLLRRGKERLTQFLEQGRRLTDLTGEFGRQMEQTQRKLSRLGRPGFRQVKGGRSTVIEDFARRLDSYAENTDQISGELVAPYAAGLDTHSRALGILAPLVPLPVSFRPAVADSSRAISGLGRSLSDLRSSVSRSRNAIAEWERIDIESLNAARRRTLDALDCLDRELTDGIHLTRQAERLAEEFLEDSDHD